MFEIFIFAIVAFLQMESLLSEKPTCVVFDFNDPLTLNEFESCTYGIINGQPFIVKSYNESSFEPFRPTTQHFLTNDENILRNCLRTKAEFRVNFRSMALKMRYNLVGDPNDFQYVDFLAAETFTPANYGATNGWTMYEKYVEFLPIEGFPDVVDGVIQLEASLTKDSAIAIEYFKFFDPKLTDEDCVPLQTDAPVTTPETDTPSIGNPSCFRVDFNQPTSVQNAFQKCDGYYLPGLILKSYTNETVKPFNDTSIYYLSNEWEGLSCLESTSLFSIKVASAFESTIFLNGLWPGAWITVDAVDVNTGEAYNLINLESDNGNEWKLLTGQVNRTIDDAQVIINTNMNSYSQLAVEYLHIC